MGDNNEVHFPVYKKLVEAGMDKKEAEEFCESLNDLIDHRIRQSSRKDFPVRKIVSIVLITVVALTVIYDCLANQDGIVRKILPEIGRLSSILK